MAERPLETLELLIEAVHSRREGVVVRDRDLAVPIGAAGQPAAEFMQFRQSFLKLPESGLVDQRILAMVRQPGQELGVISTAPSDDLLRWGQFADH